MLGKFLSIFVILNVDVVLTLPATSFVRAYNVQLFDIVKTVV